MALAGQRKCLCCGEFFFPDRRNARHQRYCAQAACRRASKAASQAAWLAKPGNADYFKGAVHVQRVRAWRAAQPHPRPRRAPAAPVLQDVLPAQVPDSIAKTANRGAPAKSSSQTPLQDLLHPSQALLAGLIAQLCDVALQDDMAQIARRLVQRGQDLIDAGVG